ncbi:MAG: flippase-like domain-containing protein [bacterium]|nr:flippase-like domain-containing protein [bacterium]
MKDKKLWIGLIISVLCIIYFIKGINWREAWQIMRTAQYIWLIPATVVFLFSFWLRAVRWQIFIDPVKHLPVKRLLPSLMIGFMGNSVLPARLGELIRPYVLGKKEKLSISAALATVVIERIFDGICMLFLLAIVLLFFAPTISSSTDSFISLPKIQAISYTFLAVNIAILFFLYLLKKYPEKLVALFTKLFGFLPEHWLEKLTHLLYSFVDGLHILHQPKQIILASFYSLAVWLTVALEILFVQYAFGLGSLSWSAPIFVMIIIAIGVMLPSAPGYVGPYHAACRSALVLLGVDVNIAVGFAVILHASQVIPIIAIGFYYLWREGLSLSEVSNSVTSTR